jgi:hypothetical protein
MRQIFIHPLVFVANGVRPCYDVLLLAAAHAHGPGLGIFAAVLIAIGAVCLWAIAQHVVLRTFSSCRSADPLRSLGNRLSRLVYLQK